MTLATPFDLPRSLLRVSGTDACDFLNRLGSGETKELKAGQLAATLFMRGDGRLVAYADCMRTETDDWLLLCEREVGQSLFEHLDRMHFAEQITISAAEPIWVWVHYGFKGGRMPADTYSGLKPYLPFPIHVNVLSEVRLPENQLDDVAERWLEFRIHFGLPSATAELLEPIVPLEANLQHAISFTKGCFPGQEVVARIENLGHPANILVKLEFTSAVEVGSEIFLGDKRVGRVTSSFQKESASIALGFVKWANREPGTELVARNHDLEIRGKVVKFEGMWEEWGK